MGGSPKQTVGYKYLLGLHLTYLLGQADKLIELTFEKRTAWVGAAKDERIIVHKPDLFGGESQQGGVSGYIDVEMGGATQGQNDYLVTQLGSQVPAFRGTTGLVFRHPWLGNTPYMKPPAAKFQRVFVTPDGAPNWYPEKAPINGAFYINETALMISLDASNSMANRLDDAKAAIVLLLQNMRDTTNTRNDVRIITWADVMTASMERRNCTTADYNDLLAFVNGLGATQHGTDYDAGITGAKDFFDGDQAVTPFDLAAGANGFPTSGQVAWDQSGDIGSGTKRRVLAFLTDGGPWPTSSVGDAVDSLSEISNLDVYCFNIQLNDTSYTEQLDNTPEDGVPVINSTNPEEILVTLETAFSSGFDYNPSHFMRDVILFPSFGTTDQAANIGDSFTPAADLFFAENFGISLKFQSPSSKRENKKEIERHVDARVYKDRATQKWEIKPIRNDYTVGELFVIDGTNATGWSGFASRLEEKLPNQVTIKYRHPNRNDTAALTLTNPARVQLAGRVINEPVEYLGIRNHDLAARICARDLKVLSSPLRSGTVTVFDLPEDINIGWAVVLDNSRLGINSAVFRIVDLKEGDGVDNAIEIDLVEDVFGIGTEALTAPPDQVKPPLVNYAEPVVLRFVEEAPYNELVRQLGQAEADSQLAANPLLAFLNLGGGAPTSDSTRSRIVVDAGAGYEGDESMDFSIAKATASSLSASGAAVQILAPLDANLLQVAIGSLAEIDGEHVRVDSIVSNSDVFALDDVFSATDKFATTALITVGRACLDTVPATHAAAAPIVFWSDGPESDFAQYFDGEAVNVKLLTQTSIDQLSVAAAPADAVTFDQRALRPYPPGNLRIDGSFATQLALADLAVTWSHRDRTLQTTSIFEDFSEGDIGPEPGVEYHLTATLVDENGADVALLDSAHLGTGTAYTLDPNGYSNFDVFAVPDKFAMADVFVRNDAFAAPDKFDLVDVFGTGQPLSARGIRVSVTSRRDGLDSRGTPSITAALFLPPTQVTSQEI